MKKYYSITMILKNTSTEDDEFTLSGKYIVADENELDSLAKDLAESYDKHKEDFDVYYEKSTVQEFIKEEEENFKNQIINEFLKRNKEKYEKLTVREYVNILRHIDEELYYEILREENKLRRMQKIVHKRIDLKSISAADYDALIVALLYAKDNNEMIALLSKYEPNENAY